MFENTKEIGLKKKKFIIKIKKINTTKICVLYKEIIKYGT